MELKIRSFESEQVSPLFYTGEWTWNGAEKQEN